MIIVSIVEELQTDSFYLRTPSSLLQTLALLIPSAVPLWIVIFGAGGL